MLAPAPVPPLSALAPRTPACARNALTRRHSTLLPYRPSQSHPTPLCSAPRRPARRQFNGVSFPFSFRNLQGACAVYVQLPTTLRFARATAVCARTHRMQNTTAHRGLCAKNRGDAIGMRALKQTSEKQKAATVGYDLQSIMQPYV